MTCDDFWKAMPELPDGADPAGHLRACAACAALMERHRSLSAGLQQIAGNGESLQPPAALEARLVEAFRQQGERRQPATRRNWLPWGVAAAAALVLLSVSLLRQHPPQPAAQVQVASSHADSAAVDSDFVPLPYAVPDLEDSGPADDDDLVQVEVPRSTLVALGVPVPVESGAGQVEAVVALGPDGMLQGIHVLQ